MTGLSQEDFERIVDTFLDDPDFWKEMKEMAPDVRADMLRDLGVPDDKIAEMQAEIESH